MKTPARLMLLSGLLALAASFGCSTTGESSNAAQTFSATDVAATAQMLVLTLQAQTAAALPSPTISPTETPTPAPTSTPTPSPKPDYSAIRYLRAQAQWAGDGVRQTVFILETGDLQGEFEVIVNRHSYRCQQFDEFPGQTWCYGPYLPPGWEDTLYLYVADQETPIFTQVFGLPIEPTPTLYGVTCIYEPLSAIGQSDSSQCYAITCTYQGRYYGGTKNSCIDPWP